MYILALQFDEMSARTRNTCAFLCILCWFGTNGVMGLKKPSTGQAREIEKWGISVFVKSESV